MLIYNITTKVDHSIADAWLQWMKEEHIPEVIATGCFSQSRILRLLEVDETDGLTLLYNMKQKVKLNTTDTLIIMPANCEKSN